MSYLAIFLAPYILSILINVVAFVVIITHLREDEAKYLNIL